MTLWRDLAPPWQVCLEQSWAAYRAGSLPIGAHEQCALCVGAMRMLASEYAARSPEPSPTAAEPEIVVEPLLEPRPLSDTPLVLIITGAPASGKTTIGRHLAAHLNLPYFSKDMFKEALFDSLGSIDRDWSRRLGMASMGLLYRCAETLLQAQQSFALECNFYAEWDTPQLRQLHERFGCRFVQVVCTADQATLVDRFARRATSGERHPGHSDASGAGRAATAPGARTLGCAGSAGPCRERRYHERCGRCGWASATRQRADWPLVPRLFAPEASKGPPFGCYGLICTFSEPLDLSAAVRNAAAACSSEKRWVTIPFVSTRADAIISMATSKS